MTSAAGQKNDFRSLKGTASDDSGGMNESTTIPNLSYAAAFGIVKLENRHRLVGALLQSLDSKALRTVPTPFGRDFTIPGQIIAARYTYSVTDNWRLTVGAAYIDVFSFTDPTAGLIYRASDGAGFSYRAGLDFSAPVNKKSKRDRLITRATARAGAYLRRPEWNGFARFSHSVPYFRPQEAAAAGAPHASYSGRSAGAPGSHAAASGSPHGSGGMPPFGRIEEIDFVLADRETGRTMLGLGGSFSLTDSFSVNGNAGLAYLTTAGGRWIWISNLRPVGLAYTFSNVELASNLTLNSDVNNYRKLSFPSLWSVDFTISYSFGRRPRES